jgi:hypothetical protein|tara:strand:- start:23200 stop:25488 length:2289 start_codon:yes stop_codon:yes gene_type:complete
MTTNVGAKTLLAKLMSEENIRVEHKKIDTAYFDVKNRVLALPIWTEMSSDLYDLLTGHEVGHALYTPSDIDVLRDAASRSSKDFVNVVEDARIEKMMKRKFAGLGGCFIRGYNDLLERDFFGDVEFSKMNLIDRINVYFKTRHSQSLLEQECFMEEELPFIEKIENLQTFENVADVSEEIYNFLKKRSEEEDTTPQAPTQFEMSDEDMDDLEDNMSDGNGMPVENDGDSEDSDEDDGMTSDSEGTGTDKSDEDTNSDDDSGKDSDEDSDEDSDATTGQGDISTGSAPEKGSKSTGQNVSAKSLEDELSSDTDNASKENMKDLVDAMAEDFRYITLGNLDVSKFVDDWKVVHEEIAQKMGTIGDHVYFPEDLTYDAVMKENSKTINYLVKEFEMKKAATAYALTRETKSGRLDAGKLWSYKINEDIFRQKSIVPQGKNHGMMMLVDWSGSMFPYLRETTIQTLVLAQFCRRAGIPFEVYSFVDQGESKYSIDDQLSGIVDGDIIPESQTGLRNLLSSRMNNRVFKTACDNVLKMVYSLTAQTWDARIAWGRDDMGSTPLNESLLIMEKMIGKFRKSNSLEKVNLVVLSDGDSNYGLSAMQTTESGDRYRQNIGRFNRTKTIVTDSETGTQFELGQGREKTNSIVQFIRAKHHVNAIGFYLTHGTTAVRHAMESFISDPQADPYTRDKQWREARKVFNKEKFVVAHSTGYNEYYIVNAKTAAVTDDLKVNHNQTKNQIAKAFASHSKSKTSNRQMLNKFVELVK